MTHNVFGETLNLALSIYLSIYLCLSVGLRSFVILLTFCSQLHHRNIQVQFILSRSSGQGQGHRSKKAFLSCSRVVCLLLKGSLVVVVDLVFSSC